MKQICLRVEAIQGYTDLEKGNKGTAVSQRGCDSVTHTHKNSLREKAAGI